MHRYFWGLKRSEKFPADYMQLRILRGNLWKESRVTRGDGSIAATVHGVRSYNSENLPTPLQTFSIRQLQNPARKTACEIYMHLQYRMSLWPNDFPHVHILGLQSDF